MHNLAVALAFAGPMGVFNPVGNAGTVGAGDRFLRLLKDAEHQTRAAAYVALSRVQYDEQYLIGGKVQPRHFLPAM